MSDHPLDFHRNEDDPETTPSSSKLKSPQKQGTLSRSYPLPRPDGPAAFKKLKERQAAEAVANIRAGLLEDLVNPIHNAPPWLQILSHLSDPSSSRSESNFPRNKTITIFEHHIRPPQYSWSGLLDRNAYPKLDRVRSYEKNEITTCRFVPYLETHNKNTPADKLKELDESSGGDGYEICLTDRICPDVLRQNFYELVEALELPSNESLLGIMGALPPSRIAKPPSNDRLIQLLASKISSQNGGEFALLYDRYSRAWTHLRRSGRLVRTPIPLRVISSGFSIAEIIDSFRLTLPANKRIYMEDSTSDSSHRDILCDICQQFYCEGHYDRPVPGKSACLLEHQSPPNKYLDALPVNTGGYVPCLHSGECFENKECECYNLKTYCDRFCQCPKSCPRRYKGCRCSRMCDDNCECVKRNRECDPLVCKCSGCRRSASCSNVLAAQKKKRTFVAPSKISGFGLYAGEPISNGDYLGEYTGVLLRSDELAKQAQLTSLCKSSYLFDLNELDTIDSGKFGNRTRFINEPPENKKHNATPSVWYVAGAQVIRIFATKRIQVGEEITFNYGGTYHARDWT
ncbi:hypothetical protein PTTG_11807 [Puccinia triticina 1-1 BBBD Race 1]|uniref:SET domain-containing protein n=2 Tax=Puccinia triticina TaxID=208348 RepID=A0A180H0G7_PUCT1|nr:uncharacterized protein PtA15_10A421 [Puccinia triticina]OAV98088.1 hypothetical protein PTTG_11807 [Puccinia triticina 1-1 BBBD Race 1]WAQ88998.1 hypothetical protein PtA15_10A421 [Puccinia triticina]